MYYCNFVIKYSEFIFKIFFYFDSFRCSKNLLTLNVIMQIIINIIFKDKLLLMMELKISEANISNYVLKISTFFSSQA